MTIGISVIIPFYNGIDFLQDAITSVVNQTYTNWELLIGINGYEDYSEIEERVMKMRLIFNEDIQKKIFVKVYDTKGAPFTLNALANDAKYDYVAFLDADDMWLPRKLERQVPYLKDYDVVGTQCKYFGNLDYCPQIPFDNISEYNIFRSNPLIHSSVLIKKELVDFEDHFVYDYNLWFKLFLQKKNFFNIYEILVMHRIHNASAFNCCNINYVQGLKDKWEKIYLANKIDD